MKDQLRHIVYVFLIFLSVLASCQTDADKQRGGVGKMADKFIVTDEFPSQQITAFAEDSRGYIWISSIKGVCRYNGNNFYQFTLANDSVDMSNVGVKCMVPDERGNMWLGSTFGILCHRYGEGIKRVTDHYVNAICDTSGDDLFYSDATNVWRVNKLTYESSLVYRFMSPRLENQIIADDYGKLWTLESEYAKCFDISSGRLETQIDVQGTFLYAAKMGNDIYISTDKGISKIDSKQGKLYMAEELAELNKALGGDLAIRVFRLNESSLILCTKGHHLYCSNTESKQVLRDDDPTFPLGGIPKEISSLFVDSHKNLWLGTDRGGYKAIFSRQSVFNRNQSLTSFFQDKAITAQCTDKDGYLWLVADKEDIYRWKRDEGVELIHSRKDADIHRILIDGLGNLWMACKDCVRCGKIMNGTYHILGEWGISALSISADPMSNVYVCAYNGRIYCKLAGYKDFQELTGKEHDYKGVKMITLHDGRMAMLESRTGVYITGIYLGTGSMDLEHLKEIVGKQTYFNDFCEDNQGRLWVATTGKGVLCIDIDSRETKVYESDEYNSNVCSVITDEKGRIWLGTSNGLTRIDPETDKIVTYYTDSGITGVEFATLGAIKMDDDFMILCNMKGMTSFFARDLPVETSEKLQLEYLSVDGNITQDLTLEDEVHLPYDNIGIDISFTSQRYGASPPAYQYQMDGFDPGWNNIHGTEHAYYSHLPAGKYVFRVKLASASGKDGEHTVRVIVHPSFLEMPVML